MKKTVLVSGGNGFIGKRLTDALLKEGYHVRIVSRRTPKNKPVNPNVSIVKADYQDCASLQRAMEGCSMVYHLAAAIFGYKYDDFAKANTRATQNLEAGELVLMHPMEHTLKALPRILGYCAEHGLRVVTVSENIG